MNRRAEILLQLERHLSADPEALRDRLGVGAKTISNDIHELNLALAQAASVRLDQGRYRLWVIDRARYTKLRTELLDGSISFNDPHTRIGYIVSRLARARAPVLVDSLASEMSVGRSTTLSDLATLRERCAPYGIEVVGRPNSGLTWQGSELTLRLYILDQQYAALYSSYPIDEELLHPLTQISSEFGLSIPTTQEITRWYTVMLDRMLTGHPLEMLPASYQAVRQLPAYAFGLRLTKAIAETIQEDIPTDEAIFLALPMVGMHTPHDTGRLELLPSSGEARPLVDTILSEITTQMGIEISDSSMLKHFTYHLAFMLNRLRFGIKIPSEPSGDLRNAYPVAYEMASITAKTVTRELGLAMADEEKYLLTSYFQVFIEEHRTLTAPAYRVAVVTRGGGVSARLVQLRVAKVMDESTDYTLLSTDEATRSTLDGFDLVVTTTVETLDTDTPLIRLAEVFDQQELLSHLNRLRFDKGVTVMLGASTRSLLAGLLSPERFMVLDPAQDYPQLLRTMLTRLVGLGSVTAEFFDRLAEREDRVSMMINDSVAFPHATLPPGAESIVLAIGVVPRHREDVGLRVIVLLGVPEKADYDDTLLVDIYDEVIRLATNPTSLDRISRFTSYEQFFFYMTNDPAHLKES